MKERARTDTGKAHQLFVVDGVIVADWAGDAVTEALRLSVAEAMNLPDFQPPMPMVIHLRTAQSSTTLESMRYALDELTGYQDHVRPIALVLADRNSSRPAHPAQDAFSSGKASEAQPLLEGAEGSTVACFADMHAAFAWIKTTSRREATGA